jgi:hypothetical protein
MVFRMVCVPRDLLTKMQFTKLIARNRMMYFKALIIRPYSVTMWTNFPMKPGSALKSLALFQDQEAPVVLERKDYPDWIGSLTKPLPSLAILRRIPDEQATDTEERRFLKLTRRTEIKKKNQELKESMS